MAKVTLKPGADIDELKRKGVKIFKWGGNTYINFPSGKKNIKEVPFNKEDCNKEDCNKEDCNKEDCNKEITHDLYCPHCGTFLIKLDVGVLSIIRGFNCSNRKCKKYVSMYELCLINEAAVKHFIVNNFMPTKAKPVVDPDFEFSKLLKYKLMQR